ncbi:MAG TPA: hypothetical protein VGG64_19490 [Pirellulales bacterium]|jgi:hypothetical protein
MPEKPRRRWFAFRLRTLFVLIAVASAPLAWVGYSLEWIRQRQRAITASEGIHFLGPAAMVERPTRKYDAPTTAPGGLWLLGEKGVAVYFWSPIAPNIDECRGLFPEAEVVRSVLPSVEREP